MAETINDLYLKYVNEVGGSLEQDRYFRYLYEMVQAGENKLTQQRQVLHKVVDERWLSTIEDALDPLNRIVENPRRFIERKEEVVPVSLAKKITADSVRHLSMNTQFIASAEEDDIQPTHILNVSVEESYNLYENRFIYHLIQRLVTFIDKRTDVIFWSTGDETQNVLRMESKVDDAYEQIDYAIEMKVKNIQSFAENDEDNMSVFMRIDRVRRLVMALKNSAFCEIMSGCQKVRSPIQRTNLLIKDRDYRVCYQLWGFLESYDEVGYSIEVEDSAIQIDEEYLIQMYTNLITNYAVFKSVTDPDRRDMEQLANTKRRVIRPKILTEVIEQEVPDRDIHDVEVKQVFVEEVTQAQLDAEAALAAERKLREETEEALRNAEQSASHSIMRAEFAVSEKMAAEDAAKAEKEKREAVEAKLADAINEREDAYLKLQEKGNELAEKDIQMSTETKEFVAQIEQQRASFTAQIDDLVYKNEHLVRDMEEDFKAQLENAELQYFEKMNQREDELNQEYDALKMKSEDEIADAAENHEKQMAAQAAVYEKQLAEKDAYYEKVLNAQLENYNKSLEESKAALLESFGEAKASYESQMAEQAKTHDVEVHRIKEDSAKELSKLKEDDFAKMTQLTERAKETIANLREQSVTLINETRQKAADDLAAAQEKAAADMAAALEAHRAEKAAADAEATEKYEALRESSRAEYQELQTRSAAELSEIKNQARAAVDDLTKASAEKESALTQRLEQLEREMAALKSANTELEAKLASAVASKQELEVRSAEAVSRFDSEHQLRVDAEGRMESALAGKNAAEREVAILKAVEDQVRATSVSEFRRALKAEKKARKGK